jgi:hypothetical protein
MNEDLLKSVAEFCPLKVAKRFLGNGHSYILTRSAKIVTKFMITFVEMRKAICSLRVPIDYFDFDSTKRAFFYLPRFYFFTYETRHVERWHKCGNCAWKKQIMLNYIDVSDFDMMYTRLQLFHLQRRMSRNDIVMIGY